MERRAALAAYAALAIGVASALAMLWLGFLPIVGSALAAIVGFVALSSSREHRVAAGTAAAIGLAGLAVQTYLLVSLFVSKG